VDSWMFIEDNREVLIPQGFLASVIGSRLWDVVISDGDSQ
jgi:hypothetical protein